MHADVFPAPFLGPSLTIGGKVASWTGSTTSGAGHVSFDQRVTFEGSTGDRVVSKLVICNDGTTAVYYSWKVRYKTSICRVPHVNEFPGCGRQIGEVKSFELDRDP